MKNCENCKNQITEIYGSGRFCSAKCARSFATKSKRSEINAKVSNTMTGKKYGAALLPPEVVRRNALKGSLKFQENSRLARESKTWDELGLNGKRNRVIKEQNNKCNICGISEWNDKPINLRFDHIDGDRFNNDRNNCRAICPNCDSQLDTYCGRNNKNRNKYTDDDLYIILEKNNFINNRAINEAKLSTTRYTQNRLNRIKRERM